MTISGDPDPARHRRYPDGLLLALTTFSVIPLRPATVDRRTAGTAMLLAPLVGGLLGLVLAGAAVGLRALHAPAVLLGATVVALGALLTRGLHLDGLADTVDGLGAYTDRDRTLAIMKSPEVGPFGVGALVLVLLAQAGAVAGLSGLPVGRLVVGVVVAASTGRAAVTWACRYGVPSARPDGMGALVAGTVSRPGALLVTGALLAASLLAVPARRWQGPLVVLVALLIAGLLRRHVVTRLGGITGDVLGALLELATVLGYLGLTLS